MTGIHRLLAGAIAIGLIVVAGWMLILRYERDYAIERDDGGAAVSSAIISSFRETSALKVASASGTVQSVAQDSRIGGWLNSDRVVKAPFSVDYFVDLSRLSPADVAWDAAAGRLRVTVPPVTIGKVNIDESRATLVRTRGLFVTRAAGEQLTRRASAKAHRLAQGKAGETALVMAARDAARRALARLLRAPVEATGQRVRTVEVRFEGEPDFPISRADRPMERSRSIKEVLGFGK